jgi:hypothetical protein
MPGTLGKSANRTTCLASSGSAPDSNLLFQSKSAKNVRVLTRFSNRSDQARPPIPPRRPGKHDRPLAGIFHDFSVPGFWMPFERWALKVGDRLAFLGALECSRVDPGQSSPGGNRVWRMEAERHRLLGFEGLTNLVEKLNEPEQSAKRWGTIDRRGP